MNFLSETETGLLKNYLIDRKKDKFKKKNGFSIVYDLTYYCNLQCYGCAVNAKYFSKKSIPRNKLESSTKDVFTVLNKIREYLDKHPDYENGFFINFGGGEPLLRADFFKIIHRSAELFGSEHVGFDSNGTLVCEESINKVSPFVSYIGISLDGLKNYHNWWRNRDNKIAFDDCYETTISNIKKIINLDSVSDKIEITSVVTTKNSNQLSDLMRIIKDIGVKKYSIHRPMQVGLMSDKDDLIPDAEGFLRLIVNLLKVNKDLKLDFHIHHSFESIYSSIFLGEDNHIAGKLWCKIGRSSIGIDPWGTIYFCPWCIVDPWTKLSPGNILNAGSTLEDILHLKGGIMDLAKEFGSPNVRCYPCREKCGRGCPIASAAAYIRKSKFIKMAEVNEQHLIDGISKEDPACPKYENIC